MPAAASWGPSGSHDFRVVLHMWSRRNAGPPDRASRKTAGANVMAPPSLGSIEGISRKLPLRSGRRRHPDVESCLEASAGDDWCDEPQGQGTKAPPPFGVTVAEPGMVF